MTVQRLTRDERRDIVNGKMVNSLISLISVTELMTIRSQGKGNQ